MGVFFLQAIRQIRPLMSATITSDSSAISQPAFADRPEYWSRYSFPAGTYDLARLQKKALVFWQSRAACPFFRKG